MRFLAANCGRASGPVTPVPVVIDFDQVRAQLASFQQANTFVAPRVEACLECLLDGVGAASSSASANDAADISDNCLDRHRHPDYLPHSGCRCPYIGTRNLTITTDAAREISDLAFGVHFHDKVGKPSYSSETIIPPGVKFKVIDLDEKGNIFLEQE